MDHSTPPPTRTSAPAAARWRFFGEAMRDPRVTGAVAPSSRRLAGALTARLREGAGPGLSVLEVGAGTGSVTRAVIPLLGPHGTLDVVEANPRFADHLRSRFGSPPPGPGGEPRMRVHQARVEQWDAGRRYDVIVSGLPLTNFAPDQVVEVMERYLQLLHPKGTLSYFVYRGSHRARRLLSSPAEARRHREVEEVLAGYHRRHATGYRAVWGNVPPADVWYLGGAVRAAATDAGPLRSAAPADRGPR